MDNAFARDRAPSTPIKFSRKIRVVSVYIEEKYMQSLSMNLILLDCRAVHLLCIVLLQNRYYFHEDPMM
jgi:hypothetical protein